MTGAGRSAPILAASVGLLLAMIQCEGTGFSGLTEVPSGERVAETEQADFSGLRLPTVALPGFKSELYYEAGGGGGLGPHCFDKVPNPIFGVPALRGAEQWGEEGALCLIGFPFDEPITLNLYRPDGGFYKAAELVVGPPDENGVSEVFEIAIEGEEMRAVGIAEEIDGMPIIHLATWWPVSQFAGEWYAEASSSSVSAEWPFTVSQSIGTDISVVPDEGLTPFGYAECPAYTSDKRLNVTGINFNLRVFDAGQPIGFYFRGEDNVLRIVAGFIVEPNSDQEVALPILLDSLGIPGEYVVVAVIRPDEDTFHLDGSGPGATACFRIIE